MCVICNDKPCPLRVALPSNPFNSKLRSINITYAPPRLRPRNTVCFTIFVVTEPVGRRSESCRALCGVSCERQSVPPHPPISRPGGGRGAVLKSPPAVTIGHTRAQMVRLPGARGCRLQLQPCAIGMSWSTAAPTALAIPGLNASHDRHSARFNLRLFDRDWR